MASCVIETRIQAPPARAFAAFTDLRNAAGRPKAIKKLEVLTDGPIGVGTRFRETREMFGREATEEMEISTFEPGRSFTISCTSCGVAYATRFDFVPGGDGTNVRVEMTTRRLTIFAKIVGPLMGAMMGKMMRKCLMADLEDLRRGIEGGGSEHLKEGETPTC